MKRRGERLLAERLSIIAALAAALPITILSIILLVNMCRDLYEREIQVQNDALRVVASEMEEKSVVMEETSMYLSTLIVLNEYMQKDFTNTGEEVIELLHTVYPSVSVVASMDRGLPKSVTVYSNNDTHPEVGSILQREEFITDPDLKAFIADEESSSIWLKDKQHPADRYINSNRGAVYMHVRKIYSAGGRRLGLAVVSVTVPDMLSSLSRLEGVQVIHGPVTDSMEGMLCQSIPRLDMTLCIQPDTDYIFQQITMNIISMLVVLALSVFLVTRLMRAIIHNVMRRLNNTVDTMMYVANGNFSVRIDDNQNDEVGMLIRQFNSLLAKLEDAVNQKVSEERSKRKAQMMALQFQVNPHFIYNSLYMLQLSLESHDLFPLSDAISYLAQILRYSLEDGSRATFGEELDNMSMYLKVINTFREGKIDLATDISDDLRKTRFMRFVMQPIAENAVKYGGSDMTEIRVQVEQMEDSIRTRVINNGLLMTGEQLEELNRNLADMDSAESHGKSIGLKNIARRLNLLYGDQAWLRVSCDDGLQVEISIPYTEVEHEDNGIAH